MSFGVCEVLHSKILPGQYFDFFGAEGPHHPTFGLRGRVGPAPSQLPWHLRLTTGVPKHRSHDTTYVRRTPPSVAKTRRSVVDERVVDDMISNDGAKPIRHNRGGGAVPPHRGSVVARV